MDWMQWIGCCVLCAVLVMILRQMNPMIASLLSIAFGVMIIAVLLPQIQGFLENVQRFLSETGLDGSYFRTMIKSMGIVLVAQIAVEACQEMGAEAIAHKVEFCSRIALLGVAIPVFLSLTEMAINVMK